MSGADMWEPQLRMTMGLKEMRSKNLYMSGADMWERKQDCKGGWGGGGRGWRNSICDFENTKN